MNTIDQDVEEVITNTLAIAGQSLAEKIGEIQTLRTRIAVLEELLNRASGQRQLQPQLQPSNATRPAPRRWSVR